MIKRAFLLLCLAGCGAVPPPAPSFYYQYEGRGVLPEVAHTVADFASVFSAPKTLNIVVAPADTSVYGFARLDNGTGYCEIVLNAFYWEGLSRLRKKALVWHEMAHCVGMGHSKNQASLLHHALPFVFQLKGVDRVTRKFKAVYGF